MTSSYLAFFASVAECAMPILSQSPRKNGLRVDCYRYLTGNRISHRLAVGDLRHKVKSDYFSM